MKRKTLPLLMMLSAGAITCVVTYIRDDELLVKMIVLLIVMIVFYFLGSLWKWALDYFEKQNAPKEEAVSEEESTLDEAKEESVSSNKSF